MALAIAWDDVKHKQRFSKPKEGVVKRGVWTNFFGTEDEPGPHAELTQFEPGRVSHPHFHGVDQFQVMIDGKGLMGRREVDRYAIHFTRAYTPYGPFVSDPDMGLTCFILHANTMPSWHSHHLPEARDMLNAVERNPWQVTSQAVFPDFDAEAHNGKFLLQEVPEMHDEHGLAGFTMMVQPNAQTAAPDPSHGVGQYVAVVKGSIMHEGKELKAPALIFVSPSEDAYQVKAGPEGLSALVLNFPKPVTRKARAA